MATSKTGVSINEMARELEIKDYKTVWTMSHKVRKAMADRDAQYTLAGLVEIDESFFGPSFSGKRGRGTEKKLVIVAVSVWKDNKGIIHNRAILRDPKDSMKLLPWTHKVIANAKAVFEGPQRGVSKKHLQSYLLEVCYRFNKRFRGREVFHRLLFACASTKTITRDEL